MLDTAPAPPHAAPSDSSADRPSLTLALAQCAHRSDGDALALARDWCARATDAGADLICFPECLMTPFETEPDEYAASAEPADGPFAQAISELARETGLWVVWTMNEADPDGGRPYNTAVVTSSSGETMSRYRKVHLFDSGTYQESSKMQAGSELPHVIETPWGRISAAICYDLRFCELSRNLALEGAELVLFPSAWVAGPQKVEQWRALLAARAVENGMFAAGLSRAGGEYAASSAVYAPDGRAVALAGTGEELVVCILDLAEVRSAREAIPVLRHRRPELYGSGA